jgi:predicted O-linked N-acetylglucosamine transferase (SPINDLY family)
VGWSERRLEGQIHDDRIDLLVDLAGHTAGNRLPLFGRRVAPVQVTWMGYFDTSGLAEMDYLLADPVLVPADSRQPFREEVWRLPGSYLCYRPPDYVPPITPPPVEQAGHLTLGCFNNLTKVNREVVAVWGEILRRLPDARLLLKNRTLADPQMRDRCQALFAAHGVSGERLDLRGPSTHPELLACYQEIDIALDPFPYSGGTTTCEALSMGVPVVTMVGANLVNRVSASFLTAVGLEALVADSPDSYADTVVALAAEPQLLAGLRQELRARMAASTLGDPARFERNLRAAYRAMWRRWCTGEPAMTDLETGLEHQRAGQLEEAAAIYRQVLAAQPREADALHLLGLVHQQRGELVEALTAVTRAIELRPLFPDAHYNLGLILQAAGYLEEAAHVLQIAVTQRPGHPDGHHQLGLVLAELGRWAGAEAAYRKALELEPDHPEARAHLDELRRVSAVVGR